ncbi:MAG: DinB family protein [Chitinophagales bacterium]
MQDQKEIFLRMALFAWDNYVKRADSLFNSLSDEQLKKEISPGKNTGIYLLGHLVAVNDTMIPIFGLGERLYKYLDNAFVETPDKSGMELPPVSELRKYWTNLNETLAKYFAGLAPAEWFQKHTLMSDEDLIKEPHRNKLSVLINRTNHLAWHYGQVLLLKE